MQADGKQKKGSVYSKRNSNSIAVPIEIDPDSDFNEGPIPIEVKKKTKRKSAKRQERDSMDDSDVSEKPRKKKRKTKEPARKAKRSDNPGNPLLEFFTKIDIYSDSSEEEPEPMEDEPSYDAEDDASEAEEGNDQVAVNKFAAYAHRKAPPSPPAVGTGETTDDDSDNEILVPVALKPPRRISNSQPADSETEPDSSSEYGFPVSSSLPSKSKPTPKNEPVSSLPSKPKPTPKHDPDSDPDKTDSDEDFEVLPPCKVAPVVNTNATAEATRQKELKPRPGFPLGADQSPLGPMVLDAKQGIQVPATINTYLRDYQREGVKFFWERYNEGCGALLGDDMGLGKTIQVISFLSAIMKKEGIKTDRNRRRNRVAALQERKAWKKNGTLPLADAKWPTCLIIAPSTVVMNWEREFKTWGYFEVGKYVGTPEERKVVLADFKKGRLDVVLTSLDLARRDISLLDDLPWSCVFVDEVHTVKNPKSKTSVAYNEFECVRRFGLTGTAIQNSYDELWTILDWTNPGKLGNTSQWRHFVSNPLKNGQSATATDEQRRRATVVSEQLHKNLLPRFFLRRTKDIIAHQLPQKSDEVVFCPLTDSQIRVYKNILAMDEVQAVLNRDELCECGSGHQQKHCCVPFDSATIFKFMSVLIKLSNHLGLILPSPNDTHEQMIRNRELAAIAFPRGNAPTLDMAILDPKKRYCGKWKVLLGLLQEWKQDPTNKVLIFTKSVKLLDMMVHQLQAESYRFLRLDGNTKHSDRMPMIDEFHRDPNIFVFLISTMAGGTGLNLTGANKVVIFDPSWNPAHDLQAMDRAFRFGQTRDVSVFRLLGAGSVEELIYARQVYKQQQMKIGYENSIQTRYFAGVQGDKSKQGELFGLKNIFKLHEGGLSTKTAIEKAHLAELDWALGSMDAPKPKSKRKSDIDIAEVETKLDKEYNELKGLGALLFDDTPIPVSQNADKTAVVRGMYTHKNPDLLVASKIEQERTKDIVQKARRKPKKSDVTSDGSPAKQWPPVRVHRKNKAPPKFEDRIKALLGTGMIKDADELASFATAFTREYTEEQQAYTLQMLDSYRGDSDDDSQNGDDGMQIEMEPEDIDMDD